MTQNQEKSEITINDQMKKFLVKGFYGFNTILTFGLGRRLGIFDYLYEKSKTLSDLKAISSISFTPEELSENLKLSSVHIDAWVHMGLECGIFEIENASTRSIKTGPHVFNLLVDRNHMFYIGDPIGLFYYLAPLQDYIIDVFKTGKIDISALPEKVFKEGQLSSARAGELTERLFSSTHREFCKVIKKGGNILAVGCGYGFNLENWAKKYRRAKFVGIDIDPMGIKGTKKMIEDNKWSDRVEAFEISVDEYTKNTDTKFDLIMLNQVLHEMDSSDEYRRSVFKDLYSLLKDDGIFLIIETIVPDLFAKKERSQLFEIMHKFFEAGFARFYNEKSFEEFVETTPFKNAKLIKERGNYFWELKK